MLIEINCPVCETIDCIECPVSIDLCKKMAEAQHAAWKLWQDVYTIVNALKEVNK